MPEPETPRDTWTTLLSELQSSLDIDITLIPNESAFHKTFVELCAGARERDPTRLLGKFLRQHDRIIAFIGALDESIGLEEETVCLDSIFWSLAVTTVQAALPRQKALIFVDGLPKLNDALPALGVQLSLFPDISQVQAPLQKIFREYIECYSMMLQLATHPTLLHPQSFDDRIIPARRLFDESRRQWAEAIKKAQEEEQKQAASMASFPKDSLGHQHPYYAPSKVSFEWIETLGHGTYGQVSKVRQPSTGRVYAQKVISVADPRLRSRIERQVENEVSIMEKLHHHHIASLCFYNRDEDNVTFSIIMLPVADHNLLQFLRTKCSSRIDRTHLTSWFGCLVSALAFAHSKKIKHEDIKPTNILIKDHQAYLADFGCAQDFSDLPGSMSTDVLAFGTPAYWPPESPPTRGRAADVFSLGCVFSEMITVRQEHTLDEYQQYRFQENSNNPYAFRDNVPKVYEWLDQLRRGIDSAGDLLIEQTLAMLERAPSDRPEATHVKRAFRGEGEFVFCNTCF